MKPVVVRSLNDPGGTRCLDLVRAGDGIFGWVLCRRDPEDNHGWRHEGPARGGFRDLDAARAGALAAHPETGEWA